MNPVLSRRSLLLLGAMAGLAACARRDDDDPNTLRVGISGAPDSYNPLIGQFATAALLFKQLYLPLTDYGMDGELVPGIAHGWKLSADRLQWVFDLREDLHWSDGSPITADDVVATVQAMLNPKSVAPDAGDFIFLENATAVLNNQKPVSDLGIFRTGPAQVTFSFHRPIGVFPELMREFYPLPAKALVPDSHWPEPPAFLGSGAYDLMQETPQEISLSANARALHKAGIANVHVQVVEDAATRARMVRAGDLDLAVDPPMNQLTQFRGMADLELHGWNAPKLLYVKPNFADPVLANIHIRQALSLSVDREFLAHSIMSGAANPAYGILPDTHADGTLAARTQQARDALHNSGQKNVTLQLLHSGGETERVALVLQQNWAQIGITCHLQGTDPQGLYSFIDEGAFQMALASFDRGLKTASWRLIEPFASDGFANNFGWNSLAYDEAVLATRAENDPIKRDALAHKAADILHADCAVIPLLWEKKFWLARKGITGFSKIIPPDFWGRLKRASV